MTESNTRDAVIVIMAGGAGERFWPVSSRTVPKQLLRIHEGRSLLDLSYSRALEIVPSPRVFIVAGTHLRRAILEELPELPESNLIEEPGPRNTAACLGLAACFIANQFGPQSVMGVLTADHLIGDPSIFIDTVRTAISRAARYDELVTIGMKPTRPDTAFGYLELGDALEPDPGMASGISISKVVRFTEKPPLNVAEDFLRRGNYLWNSGMFFWRSSTLLEAFAKFQPVMMELWSDLRGGGNERMGRPGFKETFMALPSLPIDKAIMERAPNVVAVHGAFQWEDVGSWDALGRVGKADSCGNVAFGPAFCCDSGNNIVYNEQAGAAAAEVVLFGVDDLVVVRSGSAILVMPKSRAQDLKQLLKAMSEDGRTGLM